jgi:Domain of unknown function (DUF4440)
MDDIAPGCGVVIDRLNHWNRAVVEGPVSLLDDIIDPDFELVSDAAIFTDRLDKKAFLASQSVRNICAIEFQQITARMIDRYISTLILAKVSYADKQGTADNAIVSKRLIYASVWRESAGQWRCYRHHIMCVL